MIEIGTNVFSCHFKAIQGQSRSFAFITFLDPHWPSCGQKMCENENESQRYAYMLSNGEFGPILPHSVMQTNGNSIALLATNYKLRKMI